MSSKFRQAAVVTTANVRNIGRRIWISMSMMASIALVVIVLIGFLAMARGFEAALEGAGSDSVAVVMAGGARDEKGSAIPADLRHTLAAAPASLGLATGADGAALVWPEVVVPVDATLLADGARQTLSLRGMAPAGVTLRQNVVLTAGRLAQPGAAELVVGADVARRYAGFALGDVQEFGATRWVVVGHFSAAGSAFDSEIWADLAAVQALFKREGEVQSLRIGLAPGAAVDPLAQFLTEASAQPVTVMTERAYFAGQSRRIATLIRYFGWPIAILMAIGATAGALNTMLSSVSDRAVEIATLRAIGFSRLAAFVGTWVEALVLTLIGAAIGTAIAVVLFSGWQASTQGGSAGQIAFDLKVSWGIVAQAGLLALAIGIVGGALPALKAARLPLIQAMRGV